MNKYFGIVALAAAASLVSLAGCKTEKVYNSPAPAEHTTVIHEQAPSEHVDVTPEQPKVENNIKVEH
jgi:hypothetical protein